MHPPDPVDLSPIPPLLDSYTYHSTPHHDPEPWLMGIDEAGRGPVLGPMVYAAAYCPMSFKPTLESLGFDDSKALTPEVRQSLWKAFDVHAPLCYSSANLSPQSISAGMLRKAPINLNQQAQDATISLIRSALERGVNVKECYVDALGPSPQWQAQLSQLFPTVTFTVCPKADSLFKIVGAASIIAKVTRDRYVENWSNPEDLLVGENIKPEIVSVEGDAEEHGGRGSGYPSDPRTQAFLKDHIDPIFVYKSLVRFSWATVKVLLEKQAVECRWNDDVNPASATQWFGADADPGKPKLWRDVGVGGVGEL